MKARKKPVLGRPPLPKGLKASERVNAKLTPVMAENLERTSEMWNLSKSETMVRMIDAQPRLAELVEKFQKAKAKAHRHDDEILSLRPLPPGEDPKPLDPTKLAEWVKHTQEAQKVMESIMQEIADLLSNDIVRGCVVRIRGLLGSRATFLVTRLMDGDNVEIMQMCVPASKSAPTSIIPIEQLERVR